MPELVALLGTALMFGVLGSGHCIGMCGGLMGALTLSIPEPQRRWRLLLAYNLGRTGSYGLAGLLTGLLGHAVANGPGALVLRVIAALLLVAMGLYLAGWWNGLTHIERLGRGLWRHLQPLAGRLLPMNTVPRAALVGALWGWLPCGLVYSLLLWASIQGNAATSALLMLAFGLGTWPALLLTGLAAERTRTLLRRQGLRTAGGLLVIGFGLWSLPGPHQHLLMGH